MAIRLTPKYMQDLPLNNLTDEEFLVIATEAAKKTGWKISSISQQGFIAYLDPEVFAWNAEIRIHIENGTAHIQSTSMDGEFIDYGKNEKNVKKFITHFEELKNSFTKEELAKKYGEIKKQLVPDEEDLLQLPTPTTTEKIKNFFYIFKPAKGYFITPILLDLNILVFIIMVLTGVNFLSPDSESLLKWGGNFRPVTLDGEWWRLITNCFIHIGVLHLLLNMYALLYIGVLLEPHLGKARFLTAYTLSGITASMVSVWWHDLTISAGASGAIFGMYGVFLAMLTTNLIEKTARKALLTSIGIFVAYNLIYGLRGGIDNAAHIGGLLGGIVIGYVFIPGLKRPHNKSLKLGTLGLVTILVLVSSFYVYKNIPNDIGTYDTKIKAFFTNESKALNVYNLPGNTPKDKMLTEIKDSGIYYWNKNIELIESFKDMDLPDEVKTRNRLLKEYCEIRIKVYKLMYKTVDEETEAYKEDIQTYEEEIESKVGEINRLGK